MNFGMFRLNILLREIRNGMEAGKIFPEPGKWDSQEEFTYKSDFHVAPCT